LRSIETQGEPPVTSDVLPKPTASADHPFAPYVRAVAKGEKLGRSLTMDEARAAMAMILRDEVEPVQLGAFLAVLRYRKETPEELAGFALAARDVMLPGALPPAVLDWPSYADRHKQLPYFLLSALLVAGAGVRVLMHGITGEGPANTRAALLALGVPIAPDIEAAGRLLDAGNFAYLPLEAICPALHKLFALRPLLGLRSAANTYARELNPSACPCQIQGVFHPNYADLHAGAARHMGQPRAAIFKGGGGEAQVNPRKPAVVTTLSDSLVDRVTWPALLEADDPEWRDEPLDPARITALWRGERRAPGPEAAIIGTAAIALHITGKAASSNAAIDHARQLWQERDRNRY
jgi:anthranilate phosphoribosyltransferase